MFYEEQLMIEKVINSFAKVDKIKGERYQIKVSNFESMKDDFDYGFLVVGLHREGYIVSLLKEGRELALTVTLIA